MPSNTIKSPAEAAKIDAYNTIIPNPIAETVKKFMAYPFTTYNDNSNYNNIQVLFLIPMRRT